MKIVLKEEFYNKGSVEDKLKHIKMLEDEHCKLTQCKEPDKCDVINSLFWYKHHLLMAMAKFEELEEVDYEIKYTEKLSDKAYGIERYDAEGFKNEVKK
jgi:hypothetical protein